MTQQRPKTFSQAIDDLEDKADGAKSRLERELKRMEEVIADLKPRIEEMGDEARKVKARAEDQISKNPWAAVGIVGLVFFVLGFLFGLRRRD